MAESARDVYREVIKVHVDAPLRRAQFVGRRHAWTREIAREVVPIVAAQQLLNRSDRVEFAVNWGVYNDRFAERAFGDPGRPSIQRCPFVVRVVVAPNFGDQWWAVERDRCWFVNADGSSAPTDFAELDAGLSGVIATVSALTNLQDVVDLGREIVSRGDGRAALVPGHSALDLLEEIATS